MTRKAMAMMVAMVSTSACVVPDGHRSSGSNLFEGASTIVALTFDDTFADNYEAGAMADARGMRVTFYVNSTRIGQSGSLSLPQLVDLEDRGHEIGGHTLTHANLTTLSETDARVQVCNDRLALLDAGLDVRTFAYPFGANNATVEGIVADCGYNAARDAGGLVTPTSCDGCPYANTIPPQNAYELRTQSSIGSTTPLEQIQQYVTQAEQNGGGFVPLIFHHVCDGCSSNAISPATLAAFMDWLEARAPATQVGTVKEVIGGDLQPGVEATPPDIDPPPASNLLRNPSLEADADGNQVPDCWQRGGFGTSTASFALVTDAYEGQRAQRIDITSYTTGARRLVSAQDLGTCAPPVTPGRSYTMTAFYKSNIQPLFSVYYRSTSGSWVWFAQSPRFPASSTYRQATYTTPPLPADATALSLGLSITAVGTITVDAFKLVDASMPVDTTPPTLAMSCDNATCSSTAYTAPVTVAISASDAGSGVRELRYTTDGSDPAGGTLYTGPFTLGASATVRAYAVDNANNVTTLTRSITIDSPPPTGNMLLNASLEIDANGDQIPDCWKRDGYGTNTATFTLTSDAYDGNVAQRVDITSWTSGGRRLASAQDAGACAPAAVPGRRYAVTGYYKATTAPRVSVYVRSTSGSWRWFAESALLPTSTTYRQATYTTPPLPSDATHISVGISIFDVGTITSDAMSLVEAP